eukprot:m.81117 g.81117  ORF g.81117 m.81117 type:complete len:808 (+) comp12623_c1_seq4:76-2499(+)
MGDTQSPSETGGGHVSGKSAAHAEVGHIFVVSETYLPATSEELALIQGRHVQLFEFDETGHWVFGEDTHSLQSGWFPVANVSPLDHEEEAETPALQEAPQQSQTEDAAGVALISLSEEERCTLRESQAYHALFDFTARTEDELSFHKDELLMIHEESDDGWVLGVRASKVVAPATAQALVLLVGKDIGWFPKNFVQLEGESPATVPAIVIQNTIAEEDEEQSSETLYDLAMQHATSADRSGDGSGDGPEESGELYTLASEEDGRVTPSAPESTQEQHQQHSDQSQQLEQLEQGQQQVLYDLATTGSVPAPSRDLPVTKQSPTKQQPKQPPSQQPLPDPDESAYCLPQDSVLPTRASQFYDNTGALGLLPSPDDLDPALFAKVSAATPWNCVVIAKYDCNADEQDELSFEKGAVIILLQRNEDEDWWEGFLPSKSETTGLLPRAYVRDLEPSEEKFLRGMSAIEESSLEQSDIYLKERRRVSQHLLGTDIAQVLPQSLQPLTPSSHETSPRSSVLATPIASAIAEEQETPTGPHLYSAIDADQPPKGPRLYEQLPEDMLEDQAPVSRPARPAPPPPPKPASFPSVPSESIRHNKKHTKATSRPQSSASASVHAPPTPPATPMSPPGTSPAPVLPRRTSSIRVRTKRTRNLGRSGQLSGPPPPPPPKPTAEQPGSESASSVPSLSASRDDSSTESSRPRRSAPRPARVVEDYVSSTAGHMTIYVNEIVTVLRDAEWPGWLVGRIGREREGIFPKKCVELIKRKHKKGKVGKSQPQGGKLAPSTGPPPRRKSQKALKELRDTYASPSKES